MTDSNIGKIGGVSIDEVREIVTEIYKNYSVKSEQINNPGVDSAPLPLLDRGLVIFLSDSEGKSVQVGTYSQSEVEPGEIKIYSRNLLGIEQAHVYCDSTGLVNIANSLYNLKDLIDEFVDEVKNLGLLPTLVAPSGGGTVTGTVTVDPASVATLTALKAKFDLLLGDK